MKKVLVSVAVTAALMVAGGAFAAAGGNGKGNANGKVGCELSNGNTYDNPGKMFQYLRTRTDAAAGNPKDIVNAYPNSFENVGDLIDKKCGADPS